MAGNQVYERWMAVGRWVLHKGGSEWSVVDNTRIHNMTISASWLKINAFFCAHCFCLSGARLSFLSWFFCLLFSSLPDDGLFFSLLVSPQRNLLEEQNFWKEICRMLASYVRDWDNNRSMRTPTTSESLRPPSKNYTHTCKYPGFYLYRRKQVAEKEILRGRKLSMRPVRKQEGWVFAMEWLNGRRSQKEAERGELKQTAEQALENILHKMNRGEWKRVLCSMNEVD